MAICHRSLPGLFGRKGPRMPSLRGTAMVAGELVQEFLDLVLERNRQKGAYLGTGRWWLGLRSNCPDRIQTSSVLKAEGPRAKVNFCPDRIVAKTPTPNSRSTSPGW